MSNYLFRYKFVKGLEIHYKISISGGLDIITPEGTIQNPIKMDMNIAQLVESCDDKEALLKVIIESVNAAPNMPKDKLPVVGSFSMLEMDNLGNTRWVNGKSAWEGAEHSMMVFPENELKPGDSWIKKTEDASKSAGVFFTKYRLNGYDRKNKNLSNFSTEIFSGNPEEHGSISVGKGSFSFNVDDGWMQDSGTYIKYEYSIPVPQAPGMKVRTITGLRIDMERI